MYGDYFAALNSPRVSREPSYEHIRKKFALPSARRDGRILQTYHSPCSLRLRGENIVIPISQPQLDEAEKNAVAQVLDSQLLADETRVQEFERAFAEFIGVRNAIATSSGTTALHIALLAHGIGAGDEVITTPFNFIATVNAILLAGATPVLVDIDGSFNLNPLLIEAAITPQTKAILPVHLYGQPCEMATITAVVKRHNLVLIENACQAHGAAFNQQRVGSFGTGCFSFYATKNMTTGEGGMITTNDDAVTERARALINHGMSARSQYETRGFNFRLNELAAAVGIEQLKKLEGMNARRAEHAQFYSGRLGQIPGLITPAVAPWRIHAWHQYSLRVTREFPLTRGALVEKLREAEIETRIYYPNLVNEHPSTREIFSAELHLPFASKVVEEVLSVPVHPGVTDEQREHIVRTLETLAARLAEPKQSE